MVDKNWLKIIIICDPVLIESVSDFLIGVVGAGVETGAPDELSFGTINCYVETPGLDQKEIDGILDKVAAYVDEMATIFEVDSAEIRSEIIAEDDWGKRWKEHFKPFAIVPNLVISPTWETYLPLPDEKVISMDPGMAFGTGHHATTSLALEFLEDSLEKKRGASVLDVGTGTGILGMAAIHFGAKDVMGIDNDPDAIAAAAGNIAHNFMQDRMQVGLESIERLECQYEIVVANIVHNVLVSMVRDLQRVTMEGGTLILSGLLAGEQVQSIVDKFGQHGFTCQNQTGRLEWAALRFTKESNES